MFADFECPFCKLEADVITSDFLAKHDARIVYRNFPISSHLWARDAAQIAACVFRQSSDAFWSLHDEIYLRQSEIKSTNLSKMVDGWMTGRSDIDRQVYLGCLSSRDSLKSVDEDQEFAERHGIEGTPTLFVNGVRLYGALTSKQLEAVLMQIAKVKGGPAEQGGR